MSKQGECPTGQVEGISCLRKVLIAPKKVDATGSLSVLGSTDQEIREAIAIELTCSQCTAEHDMIDWLALI